MTPIGALSSPAAMAACILARNASSISRKLGLPFAARSISATRRNSSSSLITLSPHQPGTIRKASPLKSSCGATPSAVNQSRSGSALFLLSVALKSHRRAGRSLIRDSYGLLNHLSSDGFDCGSDGLFHFPFRFLHCRTFGPGLGNRPLRRRRLRCLARLTAFG